MNVGTLRTKLADLEADLAVVMDMKDGGSVGTRIVRHVAVDVAYVVGDSRCILARVVVLGDRSGGTTHVYRGLRQAAAGQFSDAPPDVEADKGLADKLEE